MKASALLILSLMAIAGLGFDLSAASSAPVTRQELAEKLKLYESIRTLEVSFTQTKIIKDIDVRLVSEGRFKIVRPDKITWEITKPSPVVVMVDSREIRIVSGSGAGVRTQVLKLGESLPDKAAKSLMGLVAWLNLDSERLYAQYQITREGRQTYYFEPRDKVDTPFHDLELTLDNSGQLKRLLIHEVSGDTLDIAFGRPKLTPARS